MKTRISFIVENEKLTNLQFATHIGISPAAVSHILSGRNNPSLDIIAKIATRYPAYSLRWLVLGEGEPLTLHKEQSEMPTPSLTAPNIANPQLEIAIDEATTTPATPTVTPNCNTKHISPNAASECNTRPATPIDASECDTRPASDDHIDSITPTTTKLIVCFPDNTFVEYSRK